MNRTSLRILFTFRNPPLIALFLLVVTIVSTVCPEVAAIPVFVRKYRTSCTTCHTAIPKRNAFGEAFRKNGYVMPKPNRLQTKEEPVERRVDACKEVFPNSVWPGLLPAHSVPARQNVRFTLKASVVRRNIIPGIDFLQDTKTDNRKLASLKFNSFIAF